MAIASPAARRSTCTPSGSRYTSTTRASCSARRSTTRRAPSSRHDGAETAALAVPKVRPHVRHAKHVAFVPPDHRCDAPRGQTARDPRAVSVSPRPDSADRAVTVDPQGRGIVFQVRARSIGLAPHPRWIDLTLWLKCDLTHPRVRKVEDYGALGRVLHFRITSETDLDPQLMRLMEEAYAVGAQRSAAVRPPAAK